MSDVQKKDVLQQNDANPIPIGQYTISKMLGIKTVDISPKYNSEKVYSKLFEELKGKELDAYQEKYRFYQKKSQFDNEKYFFIDRFCKLLAEPQKYKKFIDKCTVQSINGLSTFIEDKCNEVVNDAAAKVANVYEQCKKEIEQLEEEIEEEIKEFEEKMEQLKKGIHGLVRSWLVTKKRPSTEKDRLALYKISFAFNLSMEDNIKLFTYVFKLKPYLRTPAEFCLTYAKEHNMEYSEAVNLYCKYFSKRIKSGNIPASETKSAENYSGTRTLMDSIKQKSEDEFIKELLNIEKQLKITHQAVKRKIKSIIGTQSIDGFFDKPRSSNYSPWYNNVDDINVESALKTYGSKAVLQLRKIYIICRTYQLWNNFKNEDKKNSFKNSFIGFYKTLSNDLIKMNLPQLDYLDDFDRGIILATAYRLHNNTTKSLGDLIDEIVKK